MALLDYCTTELQKEYVLALEAEHTETKAAEALGITRDKLHAVVKNPKRRQVRAAKEAATGNDPDHGLTRKGPEGYTLAGFSDMRTNEEGKPIWYKFSQDKEQAAALMESMVAAMASDVRAVPPMPAPTPKQDPAKDLCNLYTLTDSHVGMLAWQKEGGADWNLEIAERVLVGAFHSMMKSAPDSDLGIVAELGDFEHQDGYDAVTPTSKHNLDSAARFPKIIEASIRIRRSIIDAALAKHKQVVCVIAEGNHNIVSSMWMRKMFAALYADEPRVTIIDTELPYYAYQFGKVMLGWHHGHKKAKEALPMLFAAQFHEIWGKTEIRHIHTGHQHHLHIKEYSGAIVHQHQTLAARDAHASHGGFLSERSADCITYHKEHGQVAANFVKPSMLM